MLLHLRFNIEGETLFEQIRVFRGKERESMMLDVPPQSISQLSDVIVLVDEDAHALVLRNFNLQDDKNFVVLGVIFSDMSII